MTEKEMILEVAKIHGNYYPPAFYRNECLKRFNKRVSASSVTKAIGKYNSRLKINLEHLNSTAKKLLFLSNNDKSVACSAINML